MNEDRRVRITEVGPRDGLQNESTLVPVAGKIAFVDALGDAGFPEIEVTSFVSPKWVPQLADAAEVMSGITRRSSTTYSVLCPNQRGAEAALAAGADKISIFTSASEGFCRKNLNASIGESIERFRPVVDLARTASLPIRGYVSCMVRCPYDGPVDPEDVLGTVRRLLDLAGGDIEIALGETLGVAEPDQIEAVLDEVASVVPVSRIDLHLHDTKGMALAGVDRALQCGVRAFDSSCGGLGGCPFAPGASGNLATGPLLDMLEQGGWETGVDRAAVERAAVIASRITGRV
ncbi:MAG: hydroxymethylglutaryl-CoA lyase [Planctomycetaceae bacterium]|nr:hydroxymethylglutaryl-CoA lyase [Planctomycetaceae bacterium]